MLNWYAKTFELTERHMTKSYIRRTSVLSWILFLALPLDLIDLEWVVEKYGVFWEYVILVFAIIPLSAFFIIGVSPLVHRFWTPDKYLDEWELDVKRRGMAAGYKILAIALLCSVFYIGTKIDYTGSTDPQISIERVGNFAFGFLIIAFFAQIQAQLRKIKPIDVDELDDELRGRRRIGGKIAISVAVFLLLFGPAMIQGISDGYTEAHNEALKNEAPAEEVVK